MKKQIGNKTFRQHCVYRVGDHCTKRGISQCINDCGRFKNLKDCHCSEPAGTRVTQKEEKIRKLEGKLSATMQKHEDDLWKAGKREDNYKSLCKDLWKHKTGEIPESLWERYRDMIIREGKNEAIN